jgi:hypothetical protein
MRYFLGILGVLLGTVLIIKSDWFLANFGRNGWAEEHLGSSGGSRLMYKLIGFVFIFISMLAITGMLGGFIMAIFGSLFGIKK